ncbi:hypothetical protein CLAFUW4_04461 [Fulvia fulva]|uniref:Uncharacterized protein n=1 Tax=Passalora fulva TaxID=5499 RepID=A0A9Q8LEE8_PASFU|nr:uncharacterized protein CLAFUR5_04426 [Fulvia fulva]KAK4626432.1 hypothetical protein CLAFUR4_04447 [Fulvia fulva]KAK4628335.1 hypothetical protein CLAFUR0_04450 [Fulvia fulva]UJO15867.1 hypothetical protein CLAFUR5_04426 [Fulvia fulva]WPV13400.1 hypothetical protein CLAFUW4_04461 [Fulvia fulva]WPV28331.1 hypothetical protein CLAFUW7_04453 [Fulvia fulva]
MADIDIYALAHTSGDRATAEESQVRKHVEQQRTRVRRSWAQYLLENGVHYDEEDLFPHLVGTAQLKGFFA